MPTMAFHAGNRDADTMQLEHHSGEEIPCGLSFILRRWPTRKIHKRSFWDKKTRNFTLPIEGVDLTRNQKNQGVFKETQFFLLVYFCSSRLVTVLHIFRLSAKEAEKDEDRPIS
ncbi:hypothetical protein AMECASPLE_020532 [Ameca splendens]|uniref:Uncharacterized protein n=1 Tax=Ameca splendens TaxID=208324 RepID=A0ABV0ZQT3_9TELE